MNNPKKENNKQLDVLVLHTSLMNLKLVGSIPPVAICSLTPSLPVESCKVKELK